MIALALLVLVVPGAAVLWLALGRPRGSGWSLLLGEGWVLGALAAALATHLPGADAPASAFAGSLPWLLGGALVCAALAWWRRGPSAAAPSAFPGWPAGTGAARLWWALAALIAAHLLLAWHQAVLLPTVPWDAWSTWLGRARAWSGAETFLPLVTPEAWLQAEGAVRATLAPHYPTLVSRLAAWLASAAGGWSSAAVHAAWPALGLALAAALYGHLRRAGVTALAAMVAAFACVSLPLLDAHLALAGYADLWLSAAVAMAVLHGVHWRRTGARADLLLALLFALALPLVKLEGAVWLACLLAAGGWSLLAPRWQAALPLAGLVLLALVLPFAALPVPLPGLGTVRIGWGEIDIPVVGTLALYWRPVGAEVMASLFVLPNWHLLWLAVPLLLALHGRALAEPALRGAAAFLALAAVFLFVLFFFTDASAWAENLTSINRLVLQVAPATVAFLCLLWSGGQAPRSASTSR